MTTSFTTEFAPLCVHVQPVPAADALHAALVHSARSDAVLMCALAAADEMATFGLLQAEWVRILGAYPQFADDIESADPYVCSMSTLAELIAQAPTAVVRQALRETAYCREQMALMLGLVSAGADERAQLVLSGANAEWEILLAAHPSFSNWFATIDRFTCSRATLSDALHHAPTDPIRHALRETFCFREVAALATPHDFA